MEISTKPWMISCQTFNSCLIMLVDIMSLTHRFIRYSDQFIKYCDYLIFQNKTDNFLHFFGSKGGTVVTALTYHLWFKSRGQHHMCSQRFFLGPPIFPLSLNTNPFKMIPIRSRTQTNFNEILRTPKCSIGKQIAIYNTFLLSSKAFVKRDPKWPLVLLVSSIQTHQWIIKRWLLLILSR